MLYKVTIQREMPRKPRTSIEEQINFILNATLTGNRSSWKCTKCTKVETNNDNLYNFKVNFEFEKTEGNKSDSILQRQWDLIIKHLMKTCASNKFNKYPWKIISQNGVPVKQLKEDKINIIKSDATTSATNTPFNFEYVLSIEDLKERFPHDLLNDETGFLIENHRAFKGIYGRSYHIRLCLSSIWSFIVSNAEKSTHTLLYGLPACAKTKILHGIEALFGEGSVLKLDATNTTRPGLEKLIFEDLDEVPPLIFMEEIEKANEEALRMWLGAMDERHEFRKLNYRTCDAVKVNFLGFATANDKHLFDSMMGGRPGYPGALSSRFQQQLKCPRPSWDEMRLILERELSKIQGKNEWIDPCIELGQLINDDDPRKIISFLDGRDRLLTGHYQHDYLYATGQKDLCNKIEYKLAV